MPAAAVAVAADSSAVVEIRLQLVVALDNCLVVPVVLDDCLVVVLDDCVLAQDVYCFSVVSQPQLRLGRPTATTTQPQPRLARSERADD